MRRKLALAAVGALAAGMVSAPLAIPATAAGASSIGPMAAGSRCNDISGSPLCIGWRRDAGGHGVTVSYKKNSGPTRHVRLYIAGCGLPMTLYWEGDLSPGQTGVGTWGGVPQPGSCWVGYMRISNSQWTTGEIYS